ncbi:hypothetical protein OESDEN_11814 [Oesophagostomum dentatum]|uniref:Uncharacterized protein n=1 Tax=Oesophagostomum dentatum TaxID=61180 RepID=A0A0B1SSV5_OESDE|nr:hypothetical protein OESDEN_11814 [Oesophagostomum dentatum]
MCGKFLYAPENTAHGTTCPDYRCRSIYDRNGMGVRVYPECLEPKKLIKKKFANICATARNERFNASRKTEFEEAVAKIFFSEKDVHKLKDFRKEVLFLVENCTAWLYIRLPEDHGRLKTLVMQLLHNFLEFQEEILHPRAGFATRVEELQAAVNELLASFRRCKRKQLSSSVE